MMKKYFYTIAISLLFLSLSTSISAAPDRIIGTEKTTSVVTSNKANKLITPKKKKYINKHLKKSRTRKFGGWY